MAELVSPFARRVNPGAELVVSEDRVHRCSPSGPACQKTPPD
jgi:hypothetical protein